MPSVSQKQQKAMAIAEHDPDKLYARNEGLKSMSQNQLHDFASTPRKQLPVFRGKKKGLKKLGGDGVSDAPPSDSSSISSFPSSSSKY